MSINKRIHPCSKRVLNAESAINTHNVMVKKKSKTSERNLKYLTLFYYYWIIIFWLKSITQTHIYCTLF